MERWQKLKAWFDRHVSEEARQRISTWGRRLLIGGILLFLLIQLSEVGWKDILQNLPKQPLFYILYIGMYLCLPVAETLIYRLLWGLPFRTSFPILIQKRVYNKEVLNYSGEAHLYLWARKYVERSERLLLRDMKDNAVISSITSVLVAFVLLGTFLFTGLLPLESLVNRIQTGWIVAGGFCFILLTAVVIRFRRSVISLPARLTLILFSIHIGRLLFVQSLQILQWMIIMPEVPIKAWFTLLSLQIVVSQLPLIPAKDLLVLGASADLSRWVRVSESGVVGMLLVNVVMDKLLNLIFYAYFAWRGAFPRGDREALPLGENA